MRGPWHLWALGTLSLFWNGGGAYDYLMTKLAVPAYLEMLSEAQIAFLDAAPGWFHVGWGLGVWMSVLGSLLLLARSRLAGFAFGLSLLGMIVTLLWSLGLADPSALEITGTAGLLFSLAILVVIILLIAYSRWMTRRGHLS